MKPLPPPSPSASARVPQLRQPDRLATYEPPHYPEAVDDDGLDLRELWRIAQEAITNVERHARASRVRVSWECDGRSARLLVTDDGGHFPSCHAEADRGWIPTGQ